MPQLLVLVRHGDPEVHRPGGTDFDRLLTPEGAQALKRAFPRTFSLLNAGPTTDLELWASPAPRALQTARIVADAITGCNEDAIRTFDVLYEQDTEEIIRMIDATAAHTLVVVGHVPFVEELAYHYLGYTLPFNKGATLAIGLPEAARSAVDSSGSAADNDAASQDAAAGSTAVGTTAPAAAPVGIAPDPETQGQLLWYVRGPRPVFVGVLNVIEQELLAAGNELKETLNAFFLEPNSADTLVAMRMAQRRVRSLAEFMRPWMDSEQNRRLVESISTLQKASSRLRAFDLLERAVGDLTEGGDLGRNSSLSSICKIERSVEDAAFITFMDSPKTRKLLDDITHDLALPHWLPEVQNTGLDKETIRLQFEADCRDLEEEYSHLSLSDEEALFQARHNTKEMHYVTEGFGVLLGDVPERTVRVMDYFQSDLALLVDAIRNRDLAKECAKSPRFRGLREDLEVVARDQAELISALRSGMKRRERSE